MSQIASQGRSPFGNARYVKATECAPEFSYFDPLPRFRRELDLEELPKNAQLYLQSPGFAVCYVNGQRVTEDVFSTPISDFRKILWYDTYDVTPLLKKGKNVVSVVAGNGFLNESFKTAWDFDAAGWRDAPQFMLCLTVDGKEALVSDGAWRVDRDSSPIIFSHLRCGEFYDARKAGDAWMGEDFDDCTWQSVIVRDPSEITGELRPNLCQPVREVESYAPVAITKTDRGYLVDFGLNMSGYAEITLTAPRDTEINLTYMEEIDENGAPRHNKMDGHHFYPDTPFQVGKLIASGGEDTFKPQFTYYGFRYLLIEGLEEAPDPKKLRAIFTHNDVRKKADFVSGNEVLNFIYTAGMRSTYSNLFWCLTDCPTREKLGWTNDAQATTEQILINLEILPLFKKWYEDIKSNMREDGALPGVVPTHGWGYNWGPVCDCLLYELPYRIYLYTGDASMLIEAISSLETYANSLEGRLAAKEEFKLGDWLGHGSSKLVSKDFVNEFYLLKAFSVTAIAHRLAKTGDATWQERYDRAAAVFCEKYLDEEGRCIFDHQAPLSMMLETGLYRDREVIAKQLAAVAERDACQLTCGMVGVQYLYDALAHIGRPDLAYRFISESEPGYRTWFVNGATTLWERWDGETSGSHNHHMYSGVIAWFYKSLLGIIPDPAHPGFEEITLQPAFIKELGFVKGFEETVKGTILAEWQYTDGVFEYTVTVPEGMRVFYDGQALKVGKNTFRIYEADIRRGE